jgi:hypothetical protein
MPGIGFETTIQVFDGAKTVHALDRTATVISEETLLRIKNMRPRWYWNIRCFEF